METSPEAKVEKRPKLKKGWRITKSILGFVLPFLIIGSLPLTIWLVDQNADNTASQSNQGERWKDLLENWEKYQERGEELGYQPVDTKLFRVGLCHFGDSQYNWDESETPEAAGFICGNVNVPIYYDQPPGDGNRISVAVAIWPTYDEPHFPDPLFITQGGPGGSTLELFPEMIYPNRSGGERDLVFVEQRGTRYSYPNLNCSMTDWLDERPEDEDPDDYEYIEFLSSCRKDLVERGIHLPAFNTPRSLAILSWSARLWDTKRSTFMACLTAR